MNALLYNMVLALVWALSQGEVTLPQLFVGFVLGYFVLFACRGLLGCWSYCARVPQLFWFSLYFLYKLIEANIRVAYDVLTPTHHMTPGIIAFPLDARTEGEITLLANLISLTPGTLSLGVSPDRKVLFIHSMYLQDIEKEKRDLKQGLERRLLKVIR